MKTKIFSIVIVATFLVSSVTFAQTPKKVNKKAQHQKAMMMKKDGLHGDNFHKIFTDEQMETMKAYRLEAAKKVKPLKNELRELMAHQRTLTTADNADLKAINSNIDKMAAVKTKIAKIMAEQHQKVRALLNEEQLLKFDTMRHMRGNKMKGGPMQHHMMKG